MVAKLQNITRKAGSNPDRSFRAEDRHMTFFNAMQKASGYLHKIARQKRVQHWSLNAELVSPPVLIGD